MEAIHRDQCQALWQVNQLEEFETRSYHGCAFCFRNKNMNLDSLRAYCKTLPHVTEDVKWGDHLCFLIGEKMFCITSLNPAAPAVMTFKVDLDEFDELVEREGIAQAAYCAKRHWVSVERFQHMRDAEIRERLAQSYELVKAKLAKKQLAELGGQSTTKPSKKAEKTTKKKQ